MLYAKKNPHGGTTDKRIKLDLSASVNPLGPPQSVVRAVREAAADIYRYPDPGCADLVRAIAEEEKVPESFVLCGNGAAELIYSFCAALGRAKVLLPVPAFSEYEEALRAFGADIRFFSLPEEDFFDPDESLAEALAKERPAALFLCRPSNPAGRLADRQLVLRLAEICDELGCFLFLDECFIDLCEEPGSFAPQLYEHPFLVILKAFTKTWAMAGLRLGYCLSSDPELLGKMSRTIQPWNVSAPAQAAGIAALKEEGYRERSRALIGKERKRLEQALSSLGLAPVPSCANYILFRGPEDLAERLYALGVAVRDCADMRGLGPGWFRTAVGLPEDNDVLIKALSGICGGRADD